MIKNMNIIIQTNEGNFKLIQNSTIEEGVSVATSLSLTGYTISILPLQTILVVNNNSGTGYRLTLTDSSVSTQYLLFDTSESNILLWVSTNYPSSTIVNFTKTLMSLHIN